MPDANLTETPAAVQPAAPTPPTGSKTSLVLKIIGWIVAVAILLLAGFAYAIYRGGWQSPLATKLENFVPLPAAMVDWRIIPLADYNARFDAFKKAVALNQQVDFSDPKNKAQLDKQKQALIQRMIDLKLEGILARQRDIMVSQNEIDQEISSMLAQAGVKPEDLDKLLTQVYGWNRAQFTREVVIPQITERKLQLAVASDTTINADAYAKIKAVQARLKAGEDFAKVAQDASDDNGSKEQGGDLGWAPKGTFVPEFENAVAKLSPGQTSDIVATQYGFHIIQLLEKNDKDPNNIQYHVRHILIAGKNFGDWITDQEKQAKIWKFPLN